MADMAAKAASEDIRMMIESIEDQFKNVGLIKCGDSVPNPVDTINADLFDSVAMIEFLKDKHIKRPRASICYRGLTLAYGSLHQILSDEEQKNPNRWDICDEKITANSQSHPMLDFDYVPCCYERIFNANMFAGFYVYPFVWSNGIYFVDNDKLVSVSNGGWTKPEYYNQRLNETRQLYPEWQRTDNELALTKHIRDTYKQLQNPRMHYEIELYPQMLSMVDALNVHFADKIHATNEWIRHNAENIRYGPQWMLIPSDCYFCT